MEGRSQDKMGRKKGGWHHGGLHGGIKKPMAFAERKDNLRENSRKA